MYNWTEFTGKKTLKINKKKMSIACINAGKTRRNLAKILGIDYSNFFLRTQGKLRWQEGELYLICCALNVELCDIVQ